MAFRWGTLSGLFHSGFLRTTPSWHAALTFSNSTGPSFIVRIRPSSWNVGAELLAERCKGDNKSAASPLGVGEVLDVFDRFFVGPGPADLHGPAVWSCNLHHGQAQDGVWFSSFCSSSAAECNWSERGTGRG